MKKHLLLIVSAAMLCVSAIFFSLLPSQAANPSASQFGQRQVTGGAYTTSGYLKQGLQGLVLITSSGFTGSIGNATLPASSIITVPVYPQNYLGDIYYTVSAGTLFTIEVR